MSSRDSAKHLISSYLAMSRACRDDPDQPCASLKRARFCWIRQWFMDRHCPVTCGWCTPTRPPTPAPTPYTGPKCHCEFKNGVPKYKRNGIKCGRTGGDFKVTSYCADNEWCVGTTNQKDAVLERNKDLLCRAFSECGFSPVKQSRIVNGVTAKVGAWPWIASLEMNGRHICGGTLISPTWVLSAAHCVGKPNKPVLKLGAHNRDLDFLETWVQTIPVKRIISHPDYNRTTLKSDFALLELSRPAILDEHVQLACLPKKDTYPQPGANCYVQGWGTTTHPGIAATILQQARLPVVERSKCKYQMEAICAGYGTTTDANACRGDSGGPLVCQRSDGGWVLEGVASFVVEYCKYYTAFSPVNQYLKWINHVL